jgi:hypothetical protein
MENWEPERKAARKLRALVLGLAADARGATATGGMRVEYKKSP